MTEASPKAIAARVIMVRLRFLVIFRQAILENMNMDLPDLFEIF